MSFWTLKHASKGPRAVTGALKSAGGTPTAPTPSMRQQAPTLWRLGCKACPLDKADICTPKMAPTIVPGAEILFIAESPGRDEDENTGRPLTGPSGRLLRDAFPDGHADSASFDNIVNCRPPENRAPTWAEQECCRPRRIKVIEEAKPKLIVTLGAVPLQALLGSTDMAGLRGRVFAVKIGEHACHLMPTYHPSFILRTARDKRKPLNSMLGHCFRKDIERAFEIVGQLKPPKIDTEAEIRAGVQCIDGTKEDDFEQLMKLLKQAEKAPLKAIDLETKGLRPYRADAAIMSCAFSFDSTNFAFALDHPKTGWSVPELTDIKKRLVPIIKDDTTKVAHNVPFEAEWLIWYLGTGVINHGAWECTQMQAHFLDERKGARRDDDTGVSRYLSLDFLCKLYSGMAFKDKFRVNRKDMAKADLGETLIYNGADTKMTLRLYHHQTQLLKDRGLHEVYLETVPRQVTVATMQHIGVLVDQQAVKKAQKKLGAEISEITGKINALKVVKAFITDNKAFNPASEKDVISIFRDYLKRDEVVIKTEKQVRYSSDKNILAKIEHPLAGMIVQLRNRSMLKSTFVDGLELGVGNVIYPDGKLHTNFNTTSTETGRLSSSEPNLQNQPHRTDSWIRTQVVPTPKCYVVAIDYGQLEACTGAMCSKDKFLVKALWEDYDIHMEWAERSAHLWPDFVGGKVNISDKPLMKKFRSLIKNKLVFPAFFGASNTSVREYLVNGTGCAVPQDIVDDLMDQFWGCFDGMAAWQARTMKRYYDVGYVETPNGRRHHYPLTKNQAINQPIQGGAAELVCDAMARLSHLAVSTNQWHLHPVLNIHDDISYMVPEKHLESALDVITREMLVFGYNWVNVPLSVEISVGHNWGEVEPVEKVWSHKTYNYPRQQEA